MMQMSPIMPDDAGDANSRVCLSVHSRPEILLSDCVGTIMSWLPAPYPQAVRAPATKAASCTVTVVCMQYHTQVNQHTWREYAAYCQAPAGLCSKKMPDRDPDQPCMFWLSPKKEGNMFRVAWASSIPWQWALLAQQQPWRCPG